MQSGLYTQALVISLKETGKNILLFPIWWYTSGVKYAFLKCVSRIRYFNLYFGFTIWVKNLFVPMFGQRDIQGRLISFFIRLVQIVIRGVALLIAASLSFCLFMAWLVSPILILYFLIFT